MKRIVLEFIRRGVLSCGLGPIVLAIVYLILERCAAVETIDVRDVCLGIFSLTLLAFIAGGVNAIYRIERLPLMAAILIHGVVLYIGYLITYLVNGWLELGRAPLLIFSSVFVVGYLVIWAIVYLVIRRNTARLNEKLKQERRRTVLGNDIDNT